MLNTEKEPMTNISSQVYTTKDYFMFKPVNGNRNLNELHIRRLKESMKSNYLFTVIIVNENYRIIDGQHRFEVIKDLQLPLNYIICKGYGLAEVQILNQNSKNWTADDFMEGYCDLGKNDYIIYREFKQKYGFGYYECMGMLIGSASSGSAYRKIFDNGTFKVTNYENACKNADLICMIEPYYSGYKRRAFVYAMLQMFKNQNFEFTEFIQKLKTQPTALVDCVDTKQYVSLIEEIYNYRRREKVNLRY